MKSKSYNKIEELGKDWDLSKDQIAIVKLKTKLKERIRKRAQELDLSMSEIAEASGLTRTVVSGILNGSLQSVSMERLLRLAFALDLSIDLKIKGAA